MATFIMVTRLAPTALDGTQTVKELEEKVVGKIREEAGEIEWLANYSILGPYDYVDVFRAPDVEAAMKLSAIVRTHGHAHTEVWAATEWQRFKDLLNEVG